MGRRGVVLAALVAAMVLASAGPAAALEPVQVGGDWMAKFEAEVTVAAELRLGYDHSQGESEQPFTKRRGGFFETYGLVAGQVYREDESLIIRAAMGFFGLADPGNDDLAMFFDGGSTHGWDGDLSIEEAWAQVALAEGHWVRLGIQPFNSDHAGLVYNDSDRGVVYHGTLGEVGCNLAYFAKSYDDAVSQLNTENGRPWHVIIANLEIPVGQMQVIPSFHYSIDRTGPVETNVGYLGVSAAGMLGPLQVLGAGYWAFGEQTGGMVNPVEQTVEAYQMLFDIGYPLLEGKVIPHVGFFMGSGDDDPTDRRARGFDAIYDRVSAWGYNHYVIKNRINLGPGSLARANSGLFTLRDFDEPANFVNPGIVALNFGLTTQWTEQLTTDFNIGPAILPESAVPELVLGRRIANDVGWAINLNGTLVVSENVSVLGGLAAFIPEAGATDIFGGNTTAFNACVMLKVKV